MTHASIWPYIKTQYQLFFCLYFVRTNLPTGLFVQSVCIWLMCCVVSCCIYWLYIQFQLLFFCTLGVIYCIKTVLSKHMGIIITQGNKTHKIVALLLKLLMLLNVL